MNIQHISFDGKTNRFEDIVAVENKFNETAVFDDYDLNIIDLTNESIWRSLGNRPSTSKEHNNLKSIATQIKQSKKSKTLILLPGNIIFKYGYDKQSKRYKNNEELKDVIEEIQKPILQVLFPKEYQLSFGKTSSVIKGIDIPCDFYFSIFPMFEVASSTPAGKVSTIRYKSVYITTLQLSDSTMLKSLLIEVGIMSEESETAPDWFKEIKAFDDTDVEKKILDNKAIILQAEQTISDAEKTLKQNNYWKSVLYTTGDELADTIRQMLDKMFNVHLSEFVDAKKEDFRFNYEDKVIIGEIKGVEKNVKKAFISQLDTHVQEYLDDHPDKTQDDIVSLLIINHQRLTKPDERESIPDEQIRLAERNRSLIVESDTFLNIFEDYICQRLSETDCWNLLESNIGLLRI